MPVTRSQAHSISQRGRGTPQPGNRPSRVPTPLAIPSRSSHEVRSPISSFTGRQYHIQALSPLSAHRASEGLESNFSVDRVQGYDSGTEKYYAFQLRTPVAVRIYEPIRGKARIECSCETNRVAQSECAHIYWLFAALDAVLRDHRAEDVQPPMSIEVSLTSQLGELYPHIEQYRETLRQNLNYFRSDKGDLESDEATVEQPFSTAYGQTRADRLCDILSSFDNSMTPSEFKERFVESPPAELSPGGNGALVRDNLPATIYHLSIRNDAFYRRLEQLVTPDVRAVQYYKTQSARAQSALRTLSQYSERGPTTQRAPQNGGGINVPACARYLRSIVNEMCEDRNRRSAIAPLGASVLRRLAEFLTSLIAQVVAWDRDIYDRPQWSGIRPQDEHLRDRNLFIYLIGDPPLAPGLPGWMTDRFVLDRLRNFPSSEWSHLLELFTTIKDAIEEKDMATLPGSYAYVARIENMVHEYTATADEPSSSSVQVPRRI